jgi:glutaminyl-peptide cyclotransferase
VTKDYQAQRRLTLAAHFDSKYFKDFDFIGATDSSVPCAILVDMATALNAALDKRKQTMDRFTTVQIIFFDGEEAFVDWTSKDSIYGARHLSEKWVNTMIEIKHDQNDMLYGRTGAAYTSPIQQMDVLVLLDLLGTPEIKIPNTHPETRWFFDRLTDVQSRLANAKLLSQGYIDRVNNPADRGIFTPGQSSIGPRAMQDDHVPFYELGVPVCHLIPIPFPDVWHTVRDDADCVSHDTVVDLALIFKVLVVEYLGLDEYL